MNGTELQNLAPPHATSYALNTPATTAANSTQTLLPHSNSGIVVNGSINPTTVPPHPPSTAGSLQTLSTPHPRRDALMSFVKYFAKPLIAIIIYALTLITIYTARVRYAPLSIRASLGTWLLALLAKAGDISFAFAVEDSFDTIAWRKLVRRRGLAGNGNFGGISLIWWLSLVSSTGFSALLRIVFRGVANSAVSLWTSWRGGHLRKSLRGPWRERWKNAKGPRWSFFRLAFLLVMIPGPGIILLSDISQTNVFFPVNSMNVTGGLAKYDPRIATVYHTVYSPHISKLVQSALRDRSISWPVAPISRKCKASKSCESFLLAPLYETIGPWPFTDEVEALDAFRLERAPIYQVELWDVDSTDLEGGFDIKAECELYGGFEPYFEFSTRICIAESKLKDVLVAVWTVCQDGYSPTYDCLNPAEVGGRFKGNTNLHFYRRHADIVISRTEFTILDVKSLSEPVSQNITALSLFESINTILYRPNQTVNDPRYDRKSQQYVLTQIIGSYLWTSLNLRSRGVSFGRDWLRNLLTMPVYFFQPTMLPLNPRFSTNGSTSQPDLPEENSLIGSYCTISRRSIPGRGTVIAYTCVAGGVLLFVGVAKGIAWWWGDMEVSGFGVVDFEVLARVVEESNTQAGNTQASNNQVTNIRLDQRFGNIDGLSKGVVLERIGDLRVGLKE